MLENRQHTCKYHDQCQSFNCYDGQCHCTENENYHSGKCIKSKLLLQNCYKLLQYILFLSGKLFGASCTTDSECWLSNRVQQQPDVMLSVPICDKSNRTCQCDATSVRTHLATASVEVCIPKSKWQLCYVVCIINQSQYNFQFD